MRRETRVVTMFRTGFDKHLIIKGIHFKHQRNITEANTHSVPYRT